MIWTALDDFDRIGYLDNKNDDQNVLMNVDFNYRVSSFCMKVTGTSPYT